MWLKMERVDKTEPIKHMGMEDLQTSASEIQTMDIDRSASAPDRSPTSALGGQNLLVQSVQEPSDSNSQPQNALRSEVHLMPNGTPIDEEARLVNDIQLGQTTFPGDGVSVTAPSYNFDHAYPATSFHAGQMDTTLPHYEPHRHASSVRGRSEPVHRQTPQDGPEAEVPRIQAYAKLEFEDGEFYMNTYSVEIGRDLEAARIATGWDHEDPQIATLKRKRSSTSSREASQESAHTVREDDRHNASVAISNMGGILGPDAEESHVHKKPRLSNPNSDTSSSQPLSRNSSADLQAAPRRSQSPVMASLVDASTMQQADPEACPLIRIHPPINELMHDQEIQASARGISRRHVKIAFNFERHVFELSVSGKNGAFVDELYYGPGTLIALRNKSLIQIGGVRIKFLLPDVASGEDNAEAANRFSNTPVDSAAQFEYDEERIEGIEGKLKQHGLTLNMSTYENSFVYSSSGEDETSGDEEESEETEGSEAEGRDAKVGEAEDDGDGFQIGSPPADDNSELEERKAKAGSRSTRAKQNAKAKKNVNQAKMSGAKSPNKIKPQPEAPPNSRSVPEPTAPVVKRKGPGRPPKNGIMSKREEKLLAKQEQEAAKAAAPLPSGGKAVETNQGDQVAPSGPMKRKYTKRKNKHSHPQARQGPDGENPEHPGSVSPRQASEAPAKTPKQKKSTKRPRSPSPAIDPNNYTDAQKQRPSDSYLYLLHDVLSAAPPGGMSLPRIYRAIQRKYPYFTRTDLSNGWQSSVRHNLSQHATFRRLTREGKGWSWAINPDVPLGKERKPKKGSPPTRSAQHGPHNPQTMTIPENYQQLHPMHASHNFSQPYPMQAHQDYPPPSTMPHPYHYQGVSIPNGHAAHNHAYSQFPPPGQITYPPPGSSHQGPIASPYQHVGPNGFSSALLNGLADSSSTYQSPYQSTPPIRPPEPPVQQAASATLVNGFDGGHDSGAAEPLPPPPPPPPPASETPINQLSGPSASPAPQNHAADPAATPAPNTSQEIMQAISRFRSNLLISMREHTNVEALVSSAINRVLGHQTSSSLPANEQDPEEQTIMEVFSAMLVNLNDKSSKVQNQPSQPPPDPNP